MWQEIVTEAVTLFVVIDPIGTASIFLSLTAEATPAERRRVALKSVLVAAGLLVAFVVAGRFLLHAMGISIPSFQIAGGIILLVFGLDMVFEFAGAEPAGPSDRRDIAVYPLAVPAIAGPGTMMTVVLLTDDDRYHIGDQVITVFVLLTILLITWLLFRLAVVLHRFIGDTGASIVKRIMGLLLAAVAVDKVLSGVAAFYKELPA